MLRVALFLLATILLFPVSVEAAAARAGTIPRIYNLTLTDANTEYSQVVTGRDYQITIQCRTAFDVKMAVTEGQSGTTFFTIKDEQAYFEQIIHVSDFTYYFQSTEAGVIVEIIAWSDN